MSFYILPVECLNVEMIGKIENMYVLPAHNDFINYLLQCTTDTLVSCAFFDDIFYNLEEEDFKKIKKVYQFIFKHIIKDQENYDRFSNCTFIAIESNDYFDISDEEIRKDLADNGIILAQRIKSLLSFFILKDSEFKYTKYLPCRAGTTPHGERLYYIQNNGCVEIHPDLRSGTVKGFGIQYSFEGGDSFLPLYDQLFSRESNEIRMLIKSILIMLVDSFYIEDKGVIYIFLMRIFEKLAEPNEYINFAKVKSKLLPGLTFFILQDEMFIPQTIDSKTFRTTYHELSEKFEHLQNIRNELVHTGKSPFQDNEQMFIEDVNLMIFYIQNYINYLYVQDFETINDRDLHIKELKEEHKF